ncbi:hypothetical protein GJAV_G00021870 [Gymnothorax javanicus]|nr:hypothetical protein GJAV_G00021870 [Gymnothorax javanicus]
MENNRNLSNSGNAVFHKNAPITNTTEWEEQRKKCKEIVEDELGVTEKGMNEQENGCVAYSSSTGAPEHASVTARKPSCEHLCSGHMLRDPASDPSTVMERASGMLQDLGRLKREMKSLLQEGRQSPPPCLGSRGKLGDQNQPPRNQTGSALPGRAPPADALTDEAREPAAPPPPPPVSAGEDRSSASLPHPRTPLPVLLQKSKPPPSMFEDAGRALRRVRRHRKVLEENLEAILRARNSEALNCKLEALCCNGDAKEVERIRKMVDAWIGALSKEVQAEIAREDSAAQRALEDNASHASLPVKSRRAKDSGSLKEATGSTQSRPRFGGKKSFPRGPQGQAHEAQPKSPVPSLKTKGPHQPRLFGAPRSEEEDEEYLMKVYGKALYSGHRRTLKKGPYLRFNSPSPKSKPQRPRVVESVKGVKVKSAKTQTKSSLFQDRRGRIDSEPQYIFSPTREGHDDPGAPQTPLEGLLIPMAIPLGQPRVDAGVPQPSRVIISRQPVTVTTSIPPASRKPQPKRVSRPNVVVLQLQSEEKRAAQLQVQVLPGVDIDSVSSSLSPSSSPPPPVRPPESQAVEGIAEEEETVYPGNDYLAVADIAQEPESVETHIELNGSPEPPIPMCHSLAYPPQPPRPAESILPVIQQRDALENRLVDWVEQQLMARMIAETYPRPVPETQSSPSQPDESCSSASDIVEAAGGGGLQYFVDAGVPVDSALIRQYVTDTLAETVALMLGQRARERGPVSPPVPPDTAVPPEQVVPTPVPTPGSSPRHSDVQRTGESSPHTSPEPSEQGSSIESPPEIKPPEGQDPGPPAAERSPVATPNTTPVPTPPRVATPTAPPTPPSTDLAEHLNPWGRVELPLEEEVLHSESDDPLQDRKPVFMSVAKEEEPVSLVSVSPPPKQPSPPPHAQTPPLPPEAPPSASSLNSKSSSSSPSITETDTVGRLISEGELLLSSGPIAAVRVGGLTLPAFNTSLSSSLHGVLDIDYDPPSEGQVLRGPRVPHHRDPFLSLLARMDQGPVLQEEVTQHPEVSRTRPPGGLREEDSSAGELSEGQGPQKSSLTPHPLLRDHSTFSHLTAAPPPEQGGLLSPGQLTLPAGMIPDNGYVDQNLASLMDLEALTLTQREPRDSQDQDTDSVAPAHGRAPILVRQYQERPEDIEEPGALASTSLGQYRTLGMSVTLPSAGQDEAPASVELLETDSSENDGF